MLGVFEEFVKEANFFEEKLGFGIINDAPRIVRIGCQKNHNSTMTI